jgi:hypothetical protein
VVDPLLTERRIELAILVLILLLVLQLVYGAARLALLSKPEAVLPAADSLQVTASFVRNTLTAEQAREIVSRPLLWPERKPVAEVVKVPDTAAPKKEEFKGFKLIGLFGAGDSIGIIVRAKDKTQRLHVGEELNGWKLTSVGVRQAVFSAGSKQETLTLQPEHTNADVGHKRSERRR